MNVGLARYASTLESSEGRTHPVFMPTPHTCGVGLCNSRFSFQTHHLLRSWRCHCRILCQLASELHYSVGLVGYFCCKWVPS